MNLNLFLTLRVLSELQKLDGLPVIRGDQEEEEESHNLIFLTSYSTPSSIEIIFYLEQEAEEDSEDGSDLDEELFNDPDTQEIIRNLVL